MLCIKFITFKITGTIITVLTTQVLQYLSFTSRNCEPTSHIKNIQRKQQQ
jgi:hypothetical protein